VLFGSISSGNLALSLSCEQSSFVTSNCLPDQRGTPLTRINFREITGPALKSRQALPAAMPPGRPLFVLWPINDMVHNTLRFWKRDFRTRAAHT